MPVNQKDLEISRLERSLVSSEDQIKCAKILFNLLMSLATIHKKASADAISTKRLRDSNTILRKVKSMLPQEFCPQEITFKIVESDLPDAAHDKIVAVAVQALLWYRRECLAIPFLKEAEQARITEMFLESDQLRTAQ